MVCSGDALGVVTCVDGRLSAHQASALADCYIAGISSIVASNLARPQLHALSLE